MNKGVKDIWLSGGKLSTGKLERVISTENMTKDADYMVKDLITGEFS